MQLAKRVFKRSVRHWTPRYIVDRVRLMADERRHPDSPWLTRSMISILETWLRPTDCGLEWGSGRSTVWFARRTEKVISIEHNADWEARVRQMLIREGVPSRVDLRLHDVQSDQGRANYATAAADVPDNSLDYCLVDGYTQCRGGCAVGALRKVKSGGIIIIDNVNWFLPREKPLRAPNSRSLQEGFASPDWEKFLHMVGSWRSVWTTNGVTDTAFWVKPAV
jgi:hypothetical protein